MKNRAPAFFHGLLILLIPVFGAGEANADQPDHERIHESYVLTPGASVEVSGIAGPVEIETGRGDIADVTVTRSAGLRSSRPRAASEFVARRSVPSITQISTSCSCCRAGQT
jgi:hypothetical protein